MKMDKNTLLGLLAVGAILLGFSLWNSNQQKKYVEQKRIADSIALALQPAGVGGEAALAGAGGGSLGTGAGVGSDSAVGLDSGSAESTALADSLRRTRLGNMLVDAETAEAQTVTLSNKLMEIDFTTRGAHVENVRLEGFAKYGSKAPLTMFESGSSYFGLQLFLAGNQFVNTADYTFVSKGVEAVSTADGRPAQRLAMELPIDSTGSIQFVYTLPEDDYMVDFDVRFVGMDGRLSNQMSNLMLAWGVTLPQQEKGFTNESNYSEIAYKAPGENKIHNFGRRAKNDVGSQTVAGNVQWVAMKQQFFTTTLVARGTNLQNPELSYENQKPETGLLKKYGATANVAYNRSQSDYGFQFYFGPVKYSQLKKYDMGMERLVTMGWSIVRWVNTGLVIPVFNFLQKNGLGMGLIILILTLLIKIIILPLTYKSYLSTAKMRILKPEIDAINERYPKQEDALKKQQATMELYRKAGASPMGGCLPMLIQFPVIVALFYFFPTSIELRGQSFLWAEDLSTYDSILNLPFSIPWYGSHVSLFTLLMAVTLWLNTRMTQASQPSGPGAGMMKSMMYLMPIMMLFFFNNYASGLSYYYFLSNVITIAITWGMKMFVDDGKLHAQMKAAAAKKSAASKGKPKSKWQQRYEEALRQQQQMRKK